MLVPPGVRVEMTGFGITQGPSDDMVLAPDAPVLHVRGIAYKAIGASLLLRRNLLVYGVGGIVIPFVGIKVIDVLLVVLHLA